MMGSVFANEGRSNNVDINQLRYFVAIADCGSFSKAAARCHVSQPALSVQIQKLESRLGKVLLNRSHRRIVPTEAGYLLLPRARAILGQVEEAKQEVRNVDERKTGKILVGILMTIAPCFLVHILNSFVDQFPDIQVCLNETTTALMLSMLDAGKLDMGITSLPIRDNGFGTEILFSEEMLLALHPRHPLTRKQAICKKDLESEKFILSKEDHCLGSCALRLCSQDNILPRIVFQNGHLAMIQSLVAAGKGISLIPQTAIAETSVSITYRQLENPRPKRSIAVVTKNKVPLKTTAQKFYQHLRQASQTFKLPATNGLISLSPEETKA